MILVRTRSSAVIAAALATAAVGGASAQQPAGGQPPEAPWSMAAVAARVVEADPAVRASAALAGIAEAQYALELDKGRPKLSLSLTPLAYDRRRVFDFTAIDFYDFDISDAYADVRTLSAGGGLQYSQALPTAGALTAGVKGLLGAGDDAAGTEWTLSPSLSLSLRQPLFAGGQLIPTGAASDAKASAAIGAEQAAIDDLSRRNQAVRSAVETAGRVMLLRRTLVVQEASLASAAKRAEAFRLRRGSGTATEDAALELELGAELVMRSLVDTRLSLREAERRLASALGLRGEAGPATPPLSERLPSVGAPAALSPAASPDAARAALAARKARADAGSRAALDAPALGASVAASPRYPDSRDDPYDLARALTDFGDVEGGAGVNLNVALTLDVPLSARASRAYRARADALAAEAADAQLEQAERLAADRADSLAGRRAALLERLSIQRRIAGLEARKAERAAELASAGTASAEDAADAAAERDRAELEAFRLELELLLADLDLRALAGEDLAAVLAAAE